MPLCCCAETRQEGEATPRPYLLKDEEGQVTLGWGRGPRLRSCPWSSAPHPPCSPLLWALGLGPGTAFRGPQAPSWTQVWGSAGEDPGPGHSPQPAVAGTCSCRRFNPKGPDTPCPPSAGQGVGHSTVQGRPFRLPGTWAGPARGQHGQGLPPHVDRWMWRKLLAVGMKSLSPSARAPISWHGQRAPVLHGGACRSWKNVWSPFSAPKSWLEAGPGQALKLGTIIPESLGVLQEPPEKSSGGPVEGGVGSGPPEPRGRLSLLGHGQHGSHACLAPCAGHSEALSVRAHGREGVWHPGGLAPTVERAGLRAHPCPRPDTTQSKRGPRERGPRAHLLRVPAPCRPQCVCVHARMCDIRL